MDMLCERIKDPVFYVFTNTHNDMEWIRQNYRFDHPVQYVDNENTDYEDLRLMCGCRHFILSNSTFSWWSQYIAEYSDGIVIAPSKWFRSDGKKFIHEDERAIYLDNWILVDIP